jgi:hypothetical protein
MKKVFSLPLLLSSSAAELFSIFKAMFIALIALKSFASEGTIESSNHPHIRVLRSGRKTCITLNVHFMMCRWRSVPSVDVIEMRIWRDNAHERRFVSLSSSSFLLLPPNLHTTM